MADLFDALAATFDPELASERARANVRRALPKRFYGAVSVAPVDGLHRILLDGKPIRTPARQVLAVASGPVAAALAAEWSAQVAVIDPATMPLTRLVNSAIDGVATEIADVQAEIAAYAESDLICYRADGPERLQQRQHASWTPVLDWVDARFGRRPRTTVGVIAVDQDPALAEAVRAVLPDDAIRLAALHLLTSLTGSVFLALALAERHLDPEGVWQAAHVDEDWSIEVWGADDEAQARRDSRRADFDAAVLLLA